MNKRAITAAAAAAVVSLTGISATAADKNFEMSDLKKLSTGLLGDGELSSGYDLDNDGRVDAFDMVMLRKALMPTGEFKESELKATEENVRYIGRNLEQNGTAWLVQSGSAVEFTINAKSAEVTITGDSGINNGPEYAPRYAVLIDGEIIADEIMTDKTRTIELFSGETSRTATVKVIHLSEANQGAVGVTGIKVDSDSPSPVVPTPEKDLRIEFIGDSITCAYGVEGASQNESFKTTTENFMKSYAYLTAQKLDADYSAVCYSGHGIISGYTSGDKNTDSLVPPFYELVGKPADYQQPWDFSAKPNDVVVINLGTNDSTYIDKDFENRAPEFTEAYEDFLGQIRKNNPDAYIICTLGTMGGDKEYDCIVEAVDNYKKNTGDERVMSYWSVTHTQADGFGSDWHPNAGTQQRSAYVLADKICQALGMESDQIGLDVAADAVYEMVCNKDNGANAASYFSDYNKSFWMNTVTGGSSRSDIEAVISGVGLKKDGKYRLTFKCKAPEGMDIPVIIRNSGKTAEYFSSTFTASGEDAPFEEEFTCPAADASAEIVLQIGGMDYSNVTLSELRLEKIG